MMLSSYRKHKEELNLFNMAPTNHPVATIFLLGCIMSVVLLPHLVTAVRGQQQHNTCAVGTSSISIQEQFVDDDGWSVVYCRGTATVNKCEGECVSRSAPRITSETGYSKVCNCCREEMLVPKEVILTDCYDVSGSALHGQSYPVQIPEPDSCRCQRCSL